MCWSLYGGATNGFKDDRILEDIVVLRRFPFFHLTNDTSSARSSGVSLLACDRGDLLESLFRRSVSLRLLLFRLVVVVVVPTHPPTHVPNEC